MATVSRDVRASAGDVWAVLANGWFYASWVVGASRIRAVDAAWPAPGSVIHHSFGVWPAVIDDVTRVRAAKPEEQLELRSRGWPLGEADVRIELHPTGQEVRVVLHEEPAEGPGAVLARNPVADAAIALRNKEALRRLAALAEGGAGR